MNSIHYTHTVRLFFASMSLALGLAACDGNNAPISEPIPQGTFTRTASMDGGRELQSTILLARDSAFITDTVYSFPSGVRSVDSVHSVELELSPAGDGYYRAVEEHLASGSDVTENILRYWYFFQRGDSLFFYRGIRLRGNYTGIEGGWRLSSADSAYIGKSYTYVFTKDSVTITQSSSTGVVSVTYSYRLAQDTLRINGGPIPRFGDRFELIPGLALYLTTHADTGYEKKD